MTDFYHSMTTTTTRRWLESQSERYDSLIFISPNDIYNQKAPSPTVTFTIGAVLSVIGFIMFVFRARRMKKKIEGFGSEFAGSLMIRGLISCMIDDDETSYVIVSFTAISFLLLGVLQLNYETGYYAFIAYSCGITLVETARTFLAYCGAKDLSDIVVTSKYLQNEYHLSVKLKPINIFEDLARTHLIVAMVYTTQVVLVSLVLLDLRLKDTTDCFDGTLNCPVVGTLGSWGLYCLGIFMCLVYKLGPKGQFGHSPQDPAFWLQLLLSAKNRASTFTWYDPVEHKTRTSNLTLANVLPRFIMSTSINGLAFRLLIHSLPLQCSNRSNFVAVVFASVFMLFLVDLDDTPGHPITVTHPKENLEEKGNKKNDAVLSKNIQANHDEVDKVSKEVEKIINTARAKLDILAKRHNIAIPESATHNLVSGSLLLPPKNTNITTTLEGNNSSNKNDNHRIENNEEYLRAHGDRKDILNGARIHPHTSIHARHASSHHDDELDSSIASTGSIMYNC